MAIEAKKTSGKKMLGGRLLEAGIINEFQLSLALSEQRRTNGLLGDVLEKLGFATQDSISRLLANESKSKYVDLNNLSVDVSVLKLIPPELAKKNKLLPIDSDEKTITIAMVDTFDVIAIDSVEKYTGLRVEAVAASQQEIFDAIAEKYAQAETLTEIVDKALHSINDDEKDDNTQAVPLVRLVDRIILDAVKKRATDIHIEPENTSLRVRYRIDGILYAESLLPKNLQPSVEARIKVMANLDVTEHRLPEDGRIKFSVGRRGVDLRVSTLPTQYGQSIVLRVLDKDSVILDLASLGLRENEFEKINRSIQRPHGIILVTGPTGSGKTTTLYAALARMNSKEKSIFTLEDPIEYQLPMIRQVQVNSEVGLSFSTGLRSLLRQDPDVLLVGEIRDEETAQLATRAALTGHLVLSTLHTNSAIGAIPRMVNMGVEPYLLSSALQAIVAQRLVRRNCQHCTGDDVDAGVVLKQFGHEFDSSVAYKKGMGCEKCYETGYLGRVAIYEVIEVDKEIRSKIRPGLQEDDLNLLMERKKHTTLIDDGMLKVAEGTVSVDELFRMVQ